MSEMTRPRRCGGVDGAGAEIRDVDVPADPDDVAPAPQVHGTVDAVRGTDDVVDVRVQVVGARPEIVSRVAPVVLGGAHVRADAGTGAGGTVVEVVTGTVVVVTGRAVVVVAGIVVVVVAGALVVVVVWLPEVTTKAACRWPSSPSRSRSQTTRRAGSARRRETRTRRSDRS